MNFKSFAVALFMLFLAAALYSITSNFVCFGDRCIVQFKIDGERYLFPNSCVHVDEYFYGNRGQTFEKMFFLAWWIKTMYYPRTYVFITSYEQGRITVIPYTRKLKVVGEQVDLEERTYCADKVYIELGVE